MQDNYDAITATGAELIAISSDNINSAKSTVQKEGLTYPILSDSALDTIKAYNVIDLGNTRIARASSFVIKKHGTITWVSIDEWNERVPTSEILAELSKLR